MFNCENNLSVIYSQIWTDHLVTSLLTSITSVQLATTKCSLTSKIMSDLQHSFKTLQKKGSPYHPQFLQALRYKYIFTYLHYENKLQTYHSHLMWKQTFPSVHLLSYRGHAHSCRLPTQWRYKVKLWVKPSDVHLFL